MIREEDIAVIGLAGRFPGASTIEEFWRICCEGRETISHFTTEELAEAGIAPSLLANPNYIRSKGILADIDLFDAEFFGLSVHDATLLDPQQRLFLQCAWEVLQDAGYAPSKEKASRVGVFASTGISHYLINNILKNAQVAATLDEYQALLGNDKDFLATRVSYLLNLSGPSVNIQTGCSSSLVCIHYAMQSLLNGECDMAIAGGVSITIPQEQGYFYRKEMIGSADGHCYAFDKRAQGTVKSNGVGLVALKPLSDALEDNDAIYAVIRGSSVNNDGAQKVGFTAPNAAQQAQVIKEAVHMAEVDINAIAYIETHGTGTLLGDPIEVAALKQAFASAHDRHNQQCALASLKTNIGHLDVAAGVAGFIKVCLALYHGTIPASLNFSELNSKISLEGTPFYINTSLRDWPEGAVRCAGVSSFGVGGTNAHVVLQEAPQQGPRKSLPGSYPWHKQRYWINTAPVSCAVDFVAANLERSLVSQENRALEESLNKAWSTVLGSEPRTREEHFFNQGGHSLAAINFIEQLPEQIRSLISVTHLYQFPMFYQLLEFIEQQQKAKSQIENDTYLNPEADLFSEGGEL